MKKIRRVVVHFVGSLIEGGANPHHPPGLPTKKTAQGICGVATRVNRRRTYNG